MFLGSKTRSWRWRLPDMRRNDKARNKHQDLGVCGCQSSTEVCRALICWGLSDACTCYALIFEASKRCRLEWVGETPRSQLRQPTELGNHYHSCRDPFMGIAPNVGVVFRLRR